MEDALERASNEHRSLFYASQLKTMDVSQNIRAMGHKFTENQVKTATTETFNHFAMLEKIYQEAKLPHLYQLCKSIAQNYNSLIAILLERTAKLSLMQTAKNANNEKQEESVGKAEEGMHNLTNVLIQAKKNKLGGVPLFNQNYGRYLEDHRILEQIKLEKGKRIHRNRMELLRESIFQELNHKTDVEEFPAKNDEITNYILKSKDKNSIFNYVSYEPQLQEILAFFQNSQSEANDFLARKVGKVNQVDGTFSFSDFQREIQLKNFNFKKLIIDKFKEFIEKYKKKEHEMEQYLAEKEAYFKQLEEKYFKMQQTAVQTDLNIDEYFRSYEQKLKEAELKCQALENMKKQQMNSNEREGQLIHQLALRDNCIEKLNSRLAEQQASIEYVKKLLREQKTKKSYSVKEDPQKSQKTLLDCSEKEKEKSIQAKQSNETAQAVNEDILNLNSSHQIRKSSYMSNSWRRKQSNDGISYMSFNDLDKDAKDHETATKADKKKYVRYNVDSKFTDPEKSQSHYSKQKAIQSAENYVQTEQRMEDYIVGHYSSIDKLEKIQSVHQQEDQHDKLNRKKVKPTPSGTPKTSSKNVDFNINKNSSERLAEASRRLKQRNNITSLTKIKALEDSYHSEYQMRRNSKERPPKMAKKQSIKPIRQEVSPKKEEVKVDRLHFSKQTALQANSNEGSKEEVHMHLHHESESYEPIAKPVEKKDQLAYKIFEVVEEEEEEKQTIKNTERSQKISSIYSHKKLEFELIDKLNKELTRIKAEKQCTFQHVYSLTINPHLRHKQTRSGLDWKNVRSTDWRDRNSIEINEQYLLQINEVSKAKNKTELSKLDNRDVVRHRPKEQIKPIAMFDDLIKSTAPQNQIKKEKLKNWKKKIIANLKSQVISEKQAQQIALVVKDASTKQEAFKQSTIQESNTKQSTNNKESTIKEIIVKESTIKQSNATKQSVFNQYLSVMQSSISPTSSATPNIRSSLEVEELSQGKPLKRVSGCLRKAKLKTSCEESIESNLKIDRHEDFLTADLQLKIQELIRMQAFQPTFREKFTNLHKKCKEGSICSHINKYFQSIIKYYEQKKKRSKQSLVLPIEHIGSRVDTEQTTQKENRQSPKKLENAGSRDQSQKELSLNKGKNIVLTRNRLSQQLILPNIKDLKLLQPKTSKFVN